jgi:hypothetical protein
MFANPNAANPAKINFKNVKNYLSAQLREAGFLPDWEKEQVLWRAEAAKECTVNGSCLECGCETPDLYYGTAGCKKVDNPCFPDMMDQESWSNFKSQNNIIIEQNGK